MRNERRLCAPESEQRGRDWPARRFSLRFGAEGARGGGAARVPLERAALRTRDVPSVSLWHSSGQELNLGDVVAPRAPCPAGCPLPLGRDRARRDGRTPARPALGDRRPRTRKPTVVVSCIAARAAVSCRTLRPSRGRRHLAARTARRSSAAPPAADLAGHAGRRVLHPGSTDTAGGVVAVGRALRASAKPRRPQR
jgi:hypothetical protein